MASAQKKLHPHQPIPPQTPGPTSPFPRVEGPGQGVSLACTHTPCGLLRPVPSPRVVGSVRPGAARGAPGSSGGRGPSAARGTRRVGPFIRRWTLGLLEQGYRERWGAHLKKIVSPVIFQVYAEGRRPTRPAPARGRSRKRRHGERGARSGHVAAAAVPARASRSCHRCTRAFAPRPPRPGAPRAPGRAEHRFPLPRRGARPRRPGPTRAHVCRFARAAVRAASPGPPRGDARDPRPRPRVSGCAWPRRPPVSASARACPGLAGGRAFLPGATRAAGSSSVTRGDPTPSGQGPGLRPSVTSHTVAAAAANQARAAAPPGPALLAGDWRRRCTTRPHRPMGTWSRRRARRTASAPRPVTPSPRRLGRALRGSPWKSSSRWCALAAVS